MEIIVSARHFDLTDAIKTFAETSVQGALADFELKISSVRVTLDIQKNTHICDIAAAVKGGSINAAAETIGDMNKSITDAAEKLQVQAKKQLEKIHDKRDRETLAELDAKKSETEN